MPTSQGSLPLFSFSLLFCFFAEKNRTCASESIKQSPIPSPHVHPSGASPERAGESKTAGEGTWNARIAAGYVASQDNVEGETGRRKSKSKRRTPW